MLLRKLLFLVLAVGIGWIVQRLLNAGAQRVQRGAVAPAGGTKGRSTPMVRDRVCNTFLPESSALSTSIDGKRHYFCSERCRGQFLSTASTGATTVS